MSLQLACAAMGGYVPHSAAMIHSVLANRGDLSVHVNYLCDPQTEGRNEIERMVERLGGTASVVAVDKARLAGLPDDPLFTPAMWFRIFLPELLPAADRVLYLDCDVLALEALDALWETDLGDAHLAAVDNVFQPNHLNRPVEIGLPVGQRYFNSGVLLMNLDAMRRDSSTEALRGCATRNDLKLEWPDQDALNLVLGKRRVSLHPRWNCMNSMFLFGEGSGFSESELEDARRRPALRHFEGPGANKPWHLLSDRASRELYAGHRAETPWPEVELEGRTLGNRVRRAYRRPLNPLRA